MTGNPILDHVLGHIERDEYLRQLAEGEGE